MWSTSRKTVANNNGNTSEDAKERVALRRQVNNADQ